MSPIDARLSALQAELSLDWQQVRRHAERCTGVDPASSEAAAALVALSLGFAYQAFEQVLVSLEQALGLPPRDGERWQRRLLADAAMELPGIRGALFPSEATRDWEQLLGFRHFLRHAYAVDLDPIRLLTNVACLQRALFHTEAVLAQVLQALAVG